MHLDRSELERIAYITGAASYQTILSLLDDHDDELADAAELSHERGYQDGFEQGRELAEQELSGDGIKVLRRQAADSNAMVNALLTDLERLCELVGDATTKKARADLSLRIQNTLAMRRSGNAQT